MTKGIDVPAAAPPADRHILVQQAVERHARAVVDFEAAHQAYLDAVGALPLPELMQGPVVRVTDLTTICQAETVLQLAEEPTADFLIHELTEYRAERDRLAQIHGIADLAEVVAITAAAVVRAGRSAC